MIDSVEHEDDLATLLGGGRRGGGQKRGENLKHLRLLMQRRKVEVYLQSLDGRSVGQPVVEWLVFVVHTHGVKPATTTTTMHAHKPPTLCTRLLVDTVD